MGEHVELFHHAESAPCAQPVAELCDEAVVEAEALDPPQRVADLRVGRDAVFEADRAPRSCEGGDVAADPVLVEAEEADPVLEARHQMTCARHDGAVDLVDPAQQRFVGVGAIGEPRVEGDPEALQVCARQLLLEPLAHLGIEGQLAPLGGCGSLDQREDALAVGAPEVAGEGAHPAAQIDTSVVYEGQRGGLGGAA